MKTIKIAIIGLGKRGYSLLKDVLLPLATTEPIEITALCDLYPDRTERAAELISKFSRPRPTLYTDYREALQYGAVDAVLISSAWESHVDIAVHAMRAGIAVAMEVGGAYTVNQCFELVKVYEETKTPFMFLENCCFGRREMMILNMKEKGVLGEIVHCSGGYCHDLRDEIATGIEKRHYRLRNYLNRNAENYPTHELGPIAKILGINHGNRMLTLTSTASKAVSMHDYIERNHADNAFLMNAKFNQGDIVTTVIQCAGGETIVLTLDTTLPRYYSRGFTVRGTRGMYEEVTDSVFIDTEENRKKDFTWRRECVGNAADFAEEYDHPTWKDYLSSGVQGTHDGMDYLEFKLFIDALKHGTPMPVDVYDAAAWMAITPLSEESIACGGKPVMIPDFTNGKWVMNLID